MTYCVAMRLDTGMVFLADSRTNAGVDHVGTSRKLHVFERPGDRVMVMMTAGNLSISQSIRNLLADEAGINGRSIWTAATMADAAQIVGDAIRLAHGRDGAALEQFNIDFNVSLIFGGQIGSERCRLFQLYSAGNFIESTDESTYFQIGEAKYGRPIIDRVVTPHTPLDEAAKCALISMDSTLRSNISVGLPLDLLVYESGALAVTRFARIDEHNQYFQMIRNSWGKQLKRIFEGIDDPVWDAPGVTGADARAPAGAATLPVRIVPPTGLPPSTSGKASPVQTLAQGDPAHRQH